MNLDTIKAEINDLSQEIMGVEKKRTNLDFQIQVLFNQKLSVWRHLFAEETRKKVQDVLIESNLAAFIKKILRVISDVFVIETPADLLVK